jgi:uncharacterized protein (TIGR03382 family)
MIRTAFATRALELASVLALSGASMARAEPAQAPQAPQGSFPTPETLLPTNAKVVLSGLREPPPTFTRVGGGELAFEEFRLIDALSPNQGSFSDFLVDPGPLAGDSLAITATCAGCVPTDSTWLVGTEDDVTPPVIDTRAFGPPQVSSSGVEDVFGYHALGWSVGVSAPAVTDDFGSVLVRIETNEGDRALSRFAANETETSLVAQFDAGPQRVGCFTAFALDLAGNETPFGEEVCAEIGDASGCSASSTPSLGTAAVAAALLLRRRRPSQPKVFQG